MWLGCHVMPYAAQWSKALVEDSKAVMLALGVPVFRLVCGGTLLCPVSSRHRLHTYRVQLGLRGA